MAPLQNFLGVRQQSQWTIIASTWNRVSRYISMLPTNYSRLVIANQHLQTSYLLSYIYEHSKCQDVKSVRGNSVYPSVGCTLPKFLFYFSLHPRTVTKLCRQQSVPYVILLTWVTRVVSELKWEISVLQNLKNLLRNNTLSQGYNKRKGTLIKISFGQEIQNPHECIESLVSVINLRYYYHNAW